MCRVIDILSTISFGLIFLSLFCCSSSTTYGSAQYIVNRIDYDDGDTLLFDFESGTPYKNCGGNSAVKSVELTPCDEISEGHCVLRRGVNATCHLSFESEENSTTLTAKVYGIIGVIPIPFPCPQPDACEDSGIVCPMVKGQAYNYSITAPILNSYPKKKLWVKGELRDDNGNMVTCIELPVKIE